MRLHYFIVDDQRDLQRADAALVERIWSGRATAGELHCLLEEELRLITVLCDEQILPRICWFLRVTLREGAITDESRRWAYEAVGRRLKRRYDHPSAQWQFHGWPGDWQRQVAVALDVPACQLRRVGVGGPLVMADLWGLPMEQVLDYFEQFDDGPE